MLTLNEINRRLGAQIAAVREARGLTQEALADRLGVEQATVSRWERGAVRPGQGNTEALAVALGVSEAYFFVSPEKVLAPETKEGLIGRIVAGLALLEFDEIQAVAYFLGGLPRGTRKDRVCDRIQSPKRLKK